MKQTVFLDAGLSFSKDYLLSETKEKDVVIKHFLVKEDKDKKVKHDKGDYFSIIFDDIILNQNGKAIKKVLGKILKTFLKKYHKSGPILIVGLGNHSILGDSFGVKSLNNIIATNQYNDIYTIPKVALFAPETTNKTGISSFKLISMVVNDLKPDLIILIDSLVTNNVDNLNTSLEVNDTGIIYADSLKDNKTINYKTFNIPILTIGYPCLLNKNNKYFTLINLEDNLAILSKMVADVINDVIMS